MCIRYMSPIGPMNLEMGKRKVVGRSECLALHSYRNLPSVALQHHAHQAGG